MEEEVIKDRLVKKIKITMVSKGLSQKQLADQLTVRPSVLTRWLKNGGNITLKNLIKIGKTLDISLIDTKIDFSNE